MLVVRRARKETGDVNPERALAHIEWVIDQCEKMRDKDGELDSEWEVVYENAYEALWALKERKDDEPGSSGCGDGSGE
jgi:hypothetical protein